MSENGRTDVLATRARRAAANTGATVRRTSRGIRAKAYGKIVELHERLHAEAEQAEQAEQTEQTDLSALADVTGEAIQARRADLAGEAEQAARAESEGMGAAPGASSTPDAPATE